MEGQDDETAKREKKPSKRKTTKKGQIRTMHDMLPRAVLVSPSPFIHFCLMITQPKRERKERYEKELQNNALATMWAFLHALPVCLPT